MRKGLFTTTLFIATIMAACGRHNPETAALQTRVDSLMASHPDSAYDLLADIQDEARRTWQKADQMKYEVLLAEAMNKCYIPFTTDSILKQVTRYYDRHGSSNEQLKAYYLLGCAYRDMGEAPAAINAWQEAEERADTLGKGCDYNTLYRVYGQMAEIFHHQDLPEKELWSQKQFIKYAKLAGDTYAYIRGIELLVYPYYLSGDSAQLFHYTEEAHRLYLKYNMPQKAASVWPTAILYCLEKRHPEKVCRMMQEYEQSAGLFDEKGHIAKGREGYYYIKGIYSLENEEYKNAYDAFHMAIDAGLKYEGYIGLSHLFHKLRNMDSTLHYTDMMREEILAYRKQLRTTAVAQVQNLYNYQRNERQAQLKEKEAQRYKVLNAIGAFCIFLLIILVISIFYLRKKKEEKNIIAFNETYAKVLIDYNKAQAEAMLAREDMNEYKEKKDKEVLILKQKLATLNDQYNKTSLDTRKQRMLSDEIVTDFQNMVHPVANKKDGKTIISITHPTDGQWNALQDLFERCDPLLVHFMKREFKLSLQEYRVCILTFLNFSNGDVASLLDISAQSVTNSKKKANKKMFGDDSAQSLFYNLHHLPESV